MKKKNVKHPLGLMLGVTAARRGYYACLRGDSSNQAPYYDATPDYFDWMDGWWICNTANNLGRKLSPIDFSKSLPPNNTFKQRPQNLGHDNKAHRIKGFIAQKSS